MVFIIIGTGHFISASQGLNSSSWSQENHQVIHNVTALFQSISVIDFVFLHTEYLAVNKQEHIYTCTLSFSMQLNYFTKFFLYLHDQKVSLDWEAACLPADRSNYRQGRWTVVKWNAKKRWYMTVWFCVCLCAFPNVYLWIWLWMQQYCGFEDVCISALGFVLANVLVCVCSLSWKKKWVN